jgi:hypothetical protein
MGWRHSPVDIRYSIATVRTRTKRWLACLAFWCVFLLSIGLADRLHWIDTAWAALLLLVVVAASVYSVLLMRRHDGGALTQAGYPRWFMRFAMDEDDEAGAKKRDSAHR